MPEIAGRNVRPRVERAAPVLEPDPERGTLGSEPQSRRTSVQGAADRVSEIGNAQKNMNAVQERLLVYDEASKEVQNALTEARAAEWEKFQKFGAAVPIDGEELGGLLDAGHVAIPSRWVEVDKNDFQKGQPGYKPKYKSCLVICGNFEDREGL